MLAGNVHSAELMPRFAGTLLPVWSYVSTTQPLGRELREADRAIPGAVSDTDLADNHYRVVGGDRLMWSGGMTTWERNPRVSSRQLQPTSSEPIRSLARSSSNTSGPACSATRCTGCRRSASSRRGVWLASGFGGHGINTTAMAGNIIARAIAEGDDTLAAVLCRSSWSGRAARIGRAVAQVHYWWSRQRELRSAREARGREEEYQRVEETAVQQTYEQQYPAQPPAGYAPSAPVEPAEADITNVTVPEVADEPADAGPERYR